MFLWEHNRLTGRVIKNFFHAVTETKLKQIVYLKIINHKRFVNCVIIYKDKAFFYLQQ